MKTVQIAQLLLVWAGGLATSTPTTWPRAVPSLDAAAFAEAQTRDDTATRAFSNAQIKTSDGQCLFVDELSGDFRANLTPIQVADCGSTSGQGWDVITQGKHNNVANSMLVVSTLTNACFNFDPRRAAGNQVLLFSCGGRANGEGQVTNSQLFSFNGTSGPLAFQPENAQGQCLAVKGNVLDIASCGGAGQEFTFDGTAASPSTAVKNVQPDPVVANGPLSSSANEAGNETSDILPAASNAANSGSSNNNNDDNQNNGKGQDNGKEQSDDKNKGKGKGQGKGKDNAKGKGKGNDNAKGKGQTNNNKNNGTESAAAQGNGTAGILPSAAAANDSSAAVASNGTAVAVNNGTAAEAANKGDKNGKKKGQNNGGNNKGNDKGNGNANAQGKAQGNKNNNGGALAAALAAVESAVEGAADGSGNATEQGGQKGASKGVGNSDSLLQD